MKICMSLIFPDSLEFGFLKTQHPTDTKSLSRNTIFMFTVWMFRYKVMHSWFSHLSGIETSHRHELCTGGLKWIKLKFFFFKKSYETDKLFNFLISSSLIRDVFRTNRMTFQTARAHSIRNRFCFRIRYMCKFDEIRKEQLPIFPYCAFAAAAAIAVYSCVCDNLDHTKNIFF